MKLEKYFYIVFGSAVMVTCVNTFAELPFIASAAIFLVLVGAGVPCFYFSEKHERVEKLEQIDKFYVPLQTICLNLTECINQSKSAFEQLNKCEEYLVKLCELSEKTANSSDALYNGLNEMNKALDGNFKKLLSQLSELSNSSLTKWNKYGEQLDKLCALSEKTANSSDTLHNGFNEINKTLDEDFKKLLSQMSELNKKIKDIKENDEKINEHIENFPETVSSSMSDSFESLEKIFKDEFSETLNKQEDLFSKYDNLISKVQEDLNKVVGDSIHILKLLKDCYKNMDLKRKGYD